MNSSDEALAMSRNPGTDDDWHAKYGTARKSSGKIAALINPLSFRMSLRDRAERSMHLIEAHAGQAYQASDLSGIETALDQIFPQPRQANVSRLVIAGGDGTLQAVVSWMARHLEPEQFPDLIVLSAGRTNYVAADVGTRKHFLATLEYILNTPTEQLHPEHRDTLKFQHPGFGQQAGFFAAAGLVDFVIRDIHDWQGGHPCWWRRHHGASTVGLMRTCKRMLTGQIRYQPPVLQIGADPLGQLNGPAKLILMTTLSLRHSIANPYADCGEGAIKLTAIMVDARGFKRNFMRVLKGRFSDRMHHKNGYLSGKCNTILIKNIEQITIDGQEFELDAEHPLQIHAGPAFRFLRP